MKTYLAMAAAIIGLSFVSAGARADSAKPDNPSGFGKMISGMAKTGGIGGTASSTATTTDKGVSDEVRSGREDAGSTPNPPGHP